MCSSDLRAVAVNLISIAAPNDCRDLLFPGEFDLNPARSNLIGNPAVVVPDQTVVYLLEPMLAAVRIIAGRSGFGPLLDQPEVAESPTKRRCGSLACLGLRRVLNGASFIRGTPDFQFIETRLALVGFQNLKANESCSHRGEVLDIFPRIDRRPAMGRRLSQLNEWFKFQQLNLQV